MAKIIIAGKKYECIVDDDVYEWAKNYTWYAAVKGPNLVYVSRARKKEERLNGEFAYVNKIEET